MPFILDASITACWNYPDEQSEKAERALELLHRDGAIAPLQWWFEIHNVLLLGERRGRSTPERSAAFIAFLNNLPIRLDDLPISARLMDLARKHRLRFYDAAYLELAQREALPLATLDRALSEAARAEGIVLI